MYSSKITSGDAEIIESNSVISFNPAPYGKNPIKNKSIEPSPIKIDCYFGKHFLFRLHFEFVITEENDGRPSWKSKPSGQQTQKFIIRNLHKSKGSISSSMAFDVASSSDGSIFYVSFSATELDFSVKLEYTIYRIKGGVSSENKP